MTVVKSDNRTVAFDEGSLFRSINEATAKWHTHDQLNGVIRSTVDDLYPRGRGAPIESAQIGRVVLRHLRQLNVVSQIRFALVFLGRRDRGEPGFRDARDVRKWLREEYPQLDEARPPGTLAEVVKVRRGTRERFDRDKLKRAAAIACKGRGTDREIERLSSDITNEVMDALGNQPLVTSGQISAEVLRALRGRDDIAYLRYASTVKQFATALDYETEANALEADRRESSRRARSG